MQAPCWPGLGVGVESVMHGGVTSVCSLQRYSLCRCPNSTRSIGRSDLESKTGPHKARPTRALSFRTSASSSQTLVQVLREQVRKEVLPWVQELVQPWLDPPPAPLTDTVPPQALADADSRFIKVDGVLLHYKETGPASPDAPAVLLLHGFNGSVFNWREVMAPLSNSLQAADGSPGVRVIAFDRPPFGLSQRPIAWEGGEERNPYTNAGGARLAAGLLAALGVRRAVLVGHSMGAVTAMELWKQRPEVIAGLAFVAPALPAERTSFTRNINLGQQLRRAATMATLRTQGPGLNYVRRSLRKRAAEVQAGKLGMLHDDSRTTADVIEGYLRPMKADDWDQGSLLSFRSMSFPSDIAYQDVQQPVIIVQGEKDGMLTTSARKLAERLKQRRVGSTEYVEFNDCGHIPMDEYPDRFVDTLGPFLRQTLQ